MPSIQPKTDLNDLPLPSLVAVVNLLRHEYHTNGLSGAELTALETMRKAALQRGAWINGNGWMEVKGG